MICLEKQERILSAGPMVYSTVTPPPHPSTHGQVVFASKSWRCEGKGKGEEEQKFDPHFFIGPPPLYPPPPPPPLPLAQSIFFLFTPFFYRGPLYPPPPTAAPPLPFAQSKKKKKLYPHFFIGGPLYTPPAAALELLNILYLEEIDGNTI